MVQIALVGCSHIHTPNFVKVLNARKDIQVKMVWDPDPNLAQKYATSLTGSVSSNLDQIFSDRSIEAVVICSQTNLHQDLVVRSAKAGKHIFAEKPLGLGKTDSQIMCSEIVKAGVIFQTGYFMRGRDTILKVKELIDQGTFGRITRLRLSNCHAGGLAGWFIDKEWSWMTNLQEAGFGGFGDLGTHILDIAFYLLRSEAIRVTASIKKVTGTFGETDESGEALMELENGTIVSLAAGWVDVANPVTLTLSGLEGHAAIIEGKLYIKSPKIEGADGVTPVSSLPTPWPHAFELYLNAVTGQKVPSLVSPIEAYRNSNVMEAFYQAAHNHIWVNL